jgi:hypothetical protein
VLLDNLPFEVKGNTVRVIVGHDQLEGLSDEGLDAFRFAWWAVTRYGRVTPPNTDRAFNAAAAGHRPLGLPTSPTCSLKADEGYRGEGRQSPSPLLSSMVSTYGQTKA